MSTALPSTEALAPSTRSATASGGPLSSLLLAVAALALLVAWWAGPTIGKWAFDYPRAWQIPAARHIGAWMKWLVNEASIGLFSFTDLTRFLAALIDIPYTL